MYVVVQYTRSMPPPAARTWVARLSFYTAKTRAHVLFSFYSRTYNNNLYRVSVMCDDGLVAFRPRYSRSFHMRALEHTTGSLPQKQ